MLNLPELRDLYRRLADTPTATAFLDGSRRDPAERTAWRRRYLGRRDKLLAGLKKSRTGEDEAAEAAFRHLDEALREYEGFLPSLAWVGVASRERLEWAEPVPVPVRFSVNWTMGPFVAPYLPVLGVASRILLVTVDHQRGEIHAYAKGHLSLEEHCEVEETFELTAGVGVIQSVAGTTGFRGFPAKDAAQGPLSADRERMFETIRAATARLAGADAWVILSAPPDIRTSIRKGLGSELHSRVLDGDSPDFTMSDLERIGFAQEALGRVEEKRDGVLLDQVLNDRGPGGRGVAGRQDTLKALSRGAVSTLLIAHARLREGHEAVEPLVREAFTTGADVRLCQGAAGDILLAEGQGLAAQLRFAV